MCGSIRIGSVIQIGSHSIYLRRENLLPVQSKTPIIIFMAWTKRISFTHTHTYPGTMERRAFATHNKIFYSSSCTCIHSHAHSLIDRNGFNQFHFILSRSEREKKPISFHFTLQWNRAGWKQTMACTSVAFQLGLAWMIFTTNELINPDESKNLFQLKVQTKQHDAMIRVDIFI